MFPLISGDEHMYALIALRTRRAAMELITREGCEPPKSLLKAVFLLNEAYHLRPDIVVLDTELAQDLGALRAYHRLNGDIIALFGDETDSSVLAYIRVIDLDNKIKHQWAYRSLAAAESGLVHWLSLDDPPDGWVAYGNGGSVN